MVILYINLHILWYALKNTTVVKYLGIHINFNFQKMFIGS